MAVLVVAHLAKHLRHSLVEMIGHDLEVRRISKLAVEPEI
jgi:hypothetical protein